MPQDIRLRVEFFDHPKTLALEAACGDAGITALLRLWLWARSHRSDGRLVGLTEPMIERYAGWKGAPGVFLNATKQVPTGCGHGWVETDHDGTLVLHGWDEHQTWSLTENLRVRSASIAGKASAKARQNRKMYAPLNGSSNRTSTERSTPSPTPSPTPEESGREGEVIRGVASPAEAAGSAATERIGPRALLSMHDRQALTDADVYERAKEKGFAGGRMKWANASDEERAKFA